MIVGRTKVGSVQLCDFWVLHLDNHGRAVEQRRVGGVLGQVEDGLPHLVLDTVRARVAVLDARDLLVDVVQDRPSLL